jgi:hypothetical protein
MQEAGLGRRLTARDHPVYSHSIVNEQFILDDVERRWISLNEDNFAAKTTIPSDLPSKKNVLFSQA